MGHNLHNTHYFVGQEKQLSPLSHYKTLDLYPEYAISQNWCDFYITNVKTPPPYGTL